MNSKAVKILLEVLGAVVVSAILSFIPQEALPFVVDLAIIPLIFVALRRGLVWGCIASVLFGVIHMFLHPSGAGYFMVPFHDSVMGYGFVGVAGFFARNTVRTAFNARTSSTTLKRCNSKHYRNFCQSTVSMRWYSHRAPSLFSAEKVALAQGFFGFGMNFVVTLVVTLVLLVTPIYVKRSLYIPKGTRFLSRREQSHLLND